MALTHSAAIRNAVCNLVVDALDAGAGAGYLELQDADGVEVATLGFGDPAFGAASAGSLDDGVAQANTMTPDSSATGGNATKFVMADSDDNVVIQGTFGTTGADLIGGSAVIGVGDVVAIEDGDLFYEAMP